MKADYEKERGMREELEAALKEAKVGLDVKDKVCATIRSQVESLGAELEQVQSAMVKKEKALHDKLSKAKAKRLHEQKERKNLDARLKDSQQALSARQEEILAL